MVFLSPTTNGHQERRLQRDKAKALEAAVTETADWWVLLGAS